MTVSRLSYPSVYLAIFLWLSSCVSQVLSNSKGPSQSSVFLPNLSSAYLREWYVHSSNWISHKPSLISQLASHLSCYTYHHITLLLPSKYFLNLLTFLHILQPSLGYINLSPGLCLLNHLLILTSSQYPNQPILQIAAEVMLFKCRSKYAPENPWMNSLPS